MPGIGVGTELRPLRREQHGRNGLLPDEPLAKDGEVPGPSLHVETAVVSGGQSTPASLE